MPFLNLTMQKLSSFFNTIASSWLLFLFSVLFAVASNILIYYISSPLNTFINNDIIPDLWFGFTSDKLYELYDKWGSLGRATYVKTALCDFFPFMPAYTIFLGSILTFAAKQAGYYTDKNGRSKNSVVVVAVLLILMFDWIETGILLVSCYTYPAYQLSSTVMRLASAANQMKWIFVAGTILSFVSLVSLAVMFPACKTKQTTAPSHLKKIS